MSTPRHPRGPRGSESVKHTAWMVLRTHGPMTAFELAKAAGMSFEKARSAIKGMIECGQVRSTVVGNRGRTPSVYEVTAREPQHGPRYGASKMDRQKRPRDKPLRQIESGNGAGQIELERCWPQSAQTRGEHA